ncbi:MAG: flagellar assembly peptidoglycan hydrolase FlgJ [Pseudomonadota bacterium]
MDTRLGAGHGSTFDSGAYTDLNRLSQLKVGKERDGESNIRKVAQEFESLFLNEMMKAMRAANNVFAEGNFMNSNESKTYQDMYDQQLAVTLSKEQGVGLADVLARQLSKSSQASARPNPFAQVNNALAPSAASASSSGFKSIATVDGERNDMALINQRRLALPSLVNDRLLAGIAPQAGQTGADWIPVRAAIEAQVQGQASADPVAQVAATLPTNPMVAPTVQAKAQVLDDEAASRARPVDQPARVPGKSAFASKDDFIATLLPMAQAAAAKIGVDPRYLVAQAALETGWGKSMIRQQDGSTSHNLFGIKSHNSWDGESARVMTTEYQGGKQVKESASFRAYESFEQSFEDYVSFLQSNGRYQKALSSTENPQHFVKELQQAGYATDPQYARKIGQIARQMQTYQAVASVDSPQTRT